MYCPHCKQNSADDVVFCTNCGYPLVDESAQATLDQEQSEVSSQNASTPQEGATPQGDSSQDLQGAYESETFTYEGSNISSQGPSVDKPKKKKKRIALKITLTAIVLVLAIVGGYILSIYTGPLAVLARAAKNTYEAENFSADYWLEMYDDSNKVTYEGTAQGSWNLEKREVSFYAEVETTMYERNEVRYSFVYIVALQDEEAALCASLTSDGDAETYYEYWDVSEDIDMIFDIYEESLEKAEGKSFGDYFTEEFLEDIFGEDTTEEICDMIDLEELKDAVISYAKKLNKKSWLEENAGFTKEKKDGVTYYRFEPDFTDFVKASAPEFENVFKDEDDFEQLEDVLVEGAKEGESIISDLSFGFGVKDGLLHSTSFKATINEDGGINIEGEVTLKNVGSTSFDSDKTEKAITLAKEND